MLLNMSSCFSLWLFGCTGCFILKNVRILSAVSVTGCSQASVKNTTAVYFPQSQAEARFWDISEPDCGGSVGVETLTKTVA